MTLGVWWVLIAAVIVIVLLAISLVLVAACSWRYDHIYRHINVTYILIE